MNLGLVTSFIIAALLLLSIIGMNLRISGSSTELTLSQMTRQHLSTVADMLNDDLPNMGYDINSRTVPVLTYADSNRIQFYRNVYRDPNREPEKITWELTIQNPSGGSNPNHRTLIRVEEEAATGQRDTTRIRSGVTRFRLRYYNNEHGKDLDNHMNPWPMADSLALSAVKQIHLNLEVQSAEPVYLRAGSDGRFIRSVYEKRYSPRNIE